ncbi:hypothetical protein CLV59_109159 [Chitinophaga dinghuensis]|uniref:Uncharacterized protein n=1 Tax=Chitinophaga dinghuensis TaxID=1539050 RepID=A0A327VNZ7_9BACT|nr:hypothetical protein [Chitinophaga dinghuensis]RAJ75545.1 hypothetical protein CLV59_109159 [Chitinophaga dinghuensis]
MYRYIRNILLWVVVILPILGVAQTTVTANRVVIKDSLALDGKWIKRINNDSTLRTAGEQSVSTDGALKKYIDKVASGGGMSHEELIEAHLNPSCLEVTFEYGYKAIVDSSNKITLNIESSDGVKTIYDVSNDFPLAILYAYGKPPFSLHTEIRNNTLDSMIGLHVDARNKMQRYYIYDSNSMPGDTMRLNLSDLRGTVNISVNAFLPLSNQNFFAARAIIKNLSKDHVIDLNVGSSVGRYVYPGKVDNELHYLQDPNDFTIRCSAVRTAKYGDCYLSGLIYSDVRLKVYKNGALVWNGILSAFSNDYASVSIDASWKEYEIILEDA